MGRFWKLSSLLLFLMPAWVSAEVIGSNKPTPIYTLQDDRAASVINENFRQLFNLVSTGTASSSSLSSKLQWNYVLKGTNYTSAFDTEAVIGCDTTGGNIRVDVPQGAVSDIGRVFVIFNIGGNVCTIGAGTDTINGAGSTVSRSTAWTAYILVKNTSTNWVAWAVSP